MTNDYTPTAYQRQLQYARDLASESFSLSVAPVVKQSIRGLLARITELEAENTALKADGSDHVSAKYWNEATKARIELAKMAAAVQAARADERERCAVIVETVELTLNDIDNFTEVIAYAVRASGEETTNA